MSKTNETASERQARIAKLKALYEAGEMDAVLIPEDVNVDRLVDDVVSGTSEPERRLPELLESQKPKG